MQLRRLGVGLSLIIASGTTFADCQNTTLEQIQEDKTRVLLNPSAEAIEEKGYLRVRINESNGDVVLNYFTLPAHPAHPSHVVSAIYESGGTIWLHSRGATAGDCVAFQRWMEDFASQHERIQRQVRGKLGGE